MQQFKVLETVVHYEDNATILEKIWGATKNRAKFLHIVSINPEILVQASTDTAFNQAIAASQTHIVDGVGVSTAIQMLYGVHVERMTGVDLMQKVLREGGEQGLCIGLIGAQASLAEELARCYQAKYPQAHYFGTHGFARISEAKKEEEMAIFELITIRRPHILFFAFGSPAQEIWIEKHKSQLGGVVCIGVGGAFDMLGGRVKRAPKWVRELKLEWLFRLLLQPWRMSRQMRLITFVKAVVAQRFSGKR